MKSRKHIALLCMRRLMRVQRMVGHQHTLAVIQQYSILKRIHHVY